MLAERLLFAGSCLRGVLAAELGSCPSEAHDVEMLEWLLFNARHFVPYAGLQGKMRLASRLDDDDALAQWMNVVIYTAMFRPTAYDRVNIVRLDDCGRVGLRTTNRVVCRVARFSALPAPSPGARAARANWNEILHSTGHRR